MSTVQYTVQHCTALSSRVQWWSLAWLGLARTSLCAQLEWPGPAPAPARLRNTPQLSTSDLYNCGHNTMMTYALQNRDPRSVLQMHCIGMHYFLKTRYISILRESSFSIAQFLVLFIINISIHIRAKSINLLQMDYSTMSLLFSMDKMIMTITTHIIAPSPML